MKSDLPAIFEENVDLAGKSAVAGVVPGVRCQADPSPVHPLFHSTHSASALSTMLMMRLSEVDVALAWAA